MQLAALIQEPENNAGDARNSRAIFTLLSWSSGILRTIGTMAGSFIATPYVLYYLGPERLGAFRTAQQWTGYLPYLYFGLGPALTVLILKAASKGDHKQAAALVKGGLKLEFRQTLILVLPAAITLGLFIHKLVPASSALQTELRIGVLLYVIAVLLSPLEVFRILLECLQRGYLVNIALFVQALLIMVMSVWLARLGYGIGGQFIAMITGAAAFSLLVCSFGARLLKGFRADGAGIASITLWRLRVPMTITGIGGQINLLTDYVVLSMVSGPAAVTIFSITQRLITVLGGFVAMLTAASWAGLAEIKARSDQRLFEERVLELVRLVVGLGVVMLATLAAYNSHFVRLWVGKQYYGGDLLTILTAVQSLMLAFFLLFTWTIDLQGDTCYRVPVTACGAALNLALSFILGRRIGMYGITLATLIGYSLTELWFNHCLFCRLYDLGVSAITATALRSLLLGLPWSILVWFVSHRRLPVSWSAFGLEFGVTCLLALLYFWFVMLLRSDRQHWHERRRAAIRYQFA